MIKWIEKFKRRRPKLGEAAPALARSLANSRLALSPPSDPSLAIYDEMLRDPLVKSAITVKKLGALAVPWQLVPSDSSETAKRNARFIEHVFEELDGDATTVLFDSMDALAKGYSVLEKVYAISERKFEGTIRLRSLKPKDPALFSFDVDEFLNVRELSLRVPGEKEVRLPKGKFVVFTYGAKYGDPFGEPDLRAAYRHWLVKRELIRQWSAHLEKFASPTVLGKFKRGLPEDAQSALLDALDKLQRQSAVVYPDDVEVSLLEASRIAPSGYVEALDFHNREIARAILGQTLTTEDSQRVGSLALGKVHLQVLIMQLAGLRKHLAEKVMNEQIIRPLVDLNFGPGAYPRFVFEEPDLDVFRTGKVV